MKVYLSITKDRDTGEYRVLWREGSKSSKPDERKTYYTNDPLDAIDTLIDTGTRASRQGFYPIIYRTTTTKNAFDFWLKSTDRNLSKPEVEMIFGPEFKEKP